ncbi:MAG: uracil-DNA glycosylase [Acidobacteriota bacterium]|nr:uracil-DNA glycosylase [Acidobacteriota bacterium]
MTRWRLDPRTSQELDYLRELGFSELYRPQPIAGSAPQKTPTAGGLVGNQPHEQLDVVREEAMGCTLCDLSSGRQRVVFGSGNPQAELMFVGEGPGAEEDRQGLPFVGRAGELLTKIIQAIGLDREDVYIANIVKCRPPDNRDPTSHEAAECRRYLDRQIDLVRPRVLVALGRVAAQNLLDSNETLGRLRGSWYDVRGVPTRVTYHPAALLRNASWKRPTWEDMQIVRDRLLESKAV